MPFVPRRSIDVVSNCHNAVDNGSFISYYSISAKIMLSSENSGRGDTVRYLAFPIRHWLCLSLVQYHKKDDRDVMVAAEEEDAVTGKHTGQNRVSFRGPTRKPPPHRNAGIGSGVIDLTCRVEEVLFLSTSHQLAIVISSAPWYRPADTPKSSL